MTWPAFWSFRSNKRLQHHISPIALPKPEPISGSRRAPKSTTTITRIIPSSMGPNPNIRVSCRADTARSTRMVPLGSLTVKRSESQRPTNWTSQKSQNAFLRCRKAAFARRCLARGAGLQLVCTPYTGKGAAGQNATGFSGRIDIIAGRADAPAHGALSQQTPDNTSPPTPPC